MGDFAQVMPIIHPYVVAQARPPLTRQAYLDFRRRMSRRESYGGATLPF